MTSIRRLGIGALLEDRQFPLALFRELILSEEDFVELYFEIIFYLENKQFMTSKLNIFLVPFILSVVFVINSVSHNALAIVARVVEATTIGEPSLEDFVSLFSTGLALGLLSLEDYL